MTIPEEIEHLQTKLDQTVDDREQAELLLALLPKYSRINSADAQPHVELLLQLADKLNEPLYKAWGLHFLAFVKRIKGQYDASIDLSKQGLALFQALNEKKGTADAYNNIGSVYFGQGNYAEAIKNHFASLKLNEELGNKRGIAASYGNMGNIFEKQGNYAEALKNNFASLKLYEEIGHAQGIAISYINIGNVYFDMHNYTEALKNHFAALERCKEIGYKHGIATSYSNIGTVYAHLCRYAEAQENWFASLKLLEETGDKHGIAMSYHNIGEVYQHQGDYANSLLEQIKALKMAEEIGTKELVQACSLSLWNAYKTAGDFENALKYYEQYHKTDNEIRGMEAIKQYNSLTFMHQLERKEKDLEIEHLRNVDLKREKERSENLLLNILPAEIAEELKTKGKADAKLYTAVTVLYTDFVDFTGHGSRVSPEALVAELAACFNAFDDIIAAHHIEKIKTIGDAYMAVAGLPLANASHAENAIKAAIEIKEFMLNRRKQHGQSTFEIRIGIHSGPVVAGIIGLKKMAYDIWGDTVNTAARMEQNSEAGKINISQTTYQLIKDKFNCEYRGEIEAKNKGKLKMYFVS